MVLIQYDFFDSDRSNLSQLISDVHYELFFKIIKKIIYQGKIKSIYEFKVLKIFLIFLDNDQSIRFSSLLPFITDVRRLKWQFQKEKHQKAE